MNTITMDQIDLTITNLKDLFGSSGSKVELHNDINNVCIYSIETNYSIGKTQIKGLRKMRGKITFIDYTNNHENVGLRLLVEVRN